MVLDCTINVAEEVKVKNGISLHLPSEGENEAHHDEEGEGVWANEAHFTELRELVEEAPDEVNANEEKGEPEEEADERELESVEDI